ncbi:MAG TPA: hypothetical protein VLF90_00400 [Patescibacteria group bacterium]|nr:hypothetical protein [Patescibacteria group bacterium]
MDRTNKFAGFLVLILLALMATPLKHASAGSISIAPLRQELVVSPGQAFNSQLVVHNPTKDTISVNLSGDSFGVINEDYDYSFSKLEDTKSWLSFGSQQISLSPDATTSVVYSVSVPNNAEPGEKYIAIFASVSNKPVDNVTSIDRAGLLLYISVAGKTTKRGEVLGIQLPPLTTKRSNTWTIRLNNTGSVHFRSRVVTTTSNIFGQTVDNNTDEHLILPGTIRRFEGNTGLGALPGIYRIHFLVGQGDNPANKTTKWVLYTPLWSIVLIASIVATTGLKLNQIRSKRKSELAKMVNRPTKATPKKKKP